MKKKLVLGLAVVAGSWAQAQTFYDRLDELNVVTTAMPMLNIGPDARSAVWPTSGWA